MSDAQDTIRLYYRNVMADVVGTEDGLTDDQLDGLGETVAEIVSSIETERADGEHRYRDLPADTEMLGNVQAACDRHRALRGIARREPPPILLAGVLHVRTQVCPSRD